jgi:rhamnosyltransferase
MINKKISIVILTKNNGKTIGKVLDQIHKQQIEKDFEVIIVDSGSNDDTIDIISAFNDKLYRIQSGNFGHGRTRNLASGYGSGDYLVYLSADAIPANENWLNNLVEKLDDKNVAATFGRQIPFENTSPMERFFIQRNYPQIKKEPYLMKDFNMNSFYSNVNSAIKRSVWNKMNFNEDLIISEDYEWAKRVVDYGYRIEYVPDAPVYHSHNYGLKQVFKRYFDSGVSFSQMGLKPGVIQKGMGYFLDEMRFVAHESFTMIPYAICYDFFKFFGFIFGLHNRWIPGYMKVHLSMHSYHWKNTL